MAERSPGDALVSPLPS